MTVMEVSAGTLEVALEQYRGELVAYSYRKLGSPFEAEDAVQEAFLRAWRGLPGFESRAAIRSWLYRIATNVCLDMLGGRERRARPIDLGPAQEPIVDNLHERAEATWILPTPDPADVVVSRETVRLAFVAALQRLPPRQRAALILCEVLHWQASEVAELLGSSVASVNSALQRARATLASSELPADDPSYDEELLGRYVAAFEAYDIEALTTVIREDAVQSMPPTTCGSPGGTISSLGGGGLASAVAARVSCRPAAPTARRRSASTSRQPVAATSRGRCRCSSCQTAGSPSSPSSSTPPRSSRCSGCRSGWTGKTSSSPTKAISARSSPGTPLIRSVSPARCASNCNRASAPTVAIVRRIPSRTERRRRTHRQHR
jgi:RNA polymerase sigma-70 factor, ECF subfamily